MPERFPVCLLLAIIHVALPAAAVSAGQGPTALESIRDLRDEGRLDEALVAIDRRLEAGVAAGEEIELRLERARVLDRGGLHTQTRPVAEALEEIETAAAIASRSQAEATVLAQVELARGYYHYRAEQAEGEFAKAEPAVQAAIELARSAGATRVEAEAVHQLGLIRVFQRRTSEARQHFDRSLELDKQAGLRDWMLGEYHRHVALSYVFDGDWAKALPHYVESHQARQRANLVDASIFSGMSLGDALVETGSPDRAVTCYEEALATARRIGSAYAVALNALRLAELLERQGRAAEAREFFGQASEAASKVNRPALVERANSGIDRLRSAPICSDLRRLLTAPTVEKLRPK